MWGTFVGFGTLCDMKKPKSSKQLIRVQLASSIPFFFFSRKEYRMNFLKTTEDTNLVER